MRVTKMAQGRHGEKPPPESDDDMSDSDDEDEPAVLHVRKVAHAGGVNRIRSSPQQPGIVASWAETGEVRVSGG